MLPGGWIPRGVEKAFLGHAAHEPAGVSAVQALLELPLEFVTLEQSEEELEVLFLPGVRRRSHDEEVASTVAQVSPSWIAECC